MENKYPIGGYAPGNYQCTCGRCGANFHGDKRAVECELCALISKELFEALSPAEQEEVVKKNIEAYNEFMKQNSSIEQLSGADQVCGKTELNNLATISNMHGAVWMKADIKPEYNVGVLVFIPGEDNHITSGMWDIENKWVLLDEYRVPECEVTHWMELPGLPDGVDKNELPDEIVKALKRIARDELKRGKSPPNQSDAVEFAEWIRNENWEGRTHVGWINHTHAPDLLGNRRFYSTEQLYELYQQSKK